MTDINSIGVKTTFVLLIVYSLYIIVKKLILSHGSLRDTESVHRMFILVGGILLGIGIGGQTSAPWNSEFFEAETYLGGLLTLLGFLLILFGSFIINSSIWKPLEEISEYSAEFGESFIATRLPITGGLEIQRFAERFNENVLKLANKIANFQIQMEYLDINVHQTVNAGNDVTNQSRLLSDFIINYTNISTEQHVIITNIENQLTNFVSWYSDTQVALSEQFIELRSIAEMSNLLSVNAAIEAANLEERNPGFETIASKLHELSRSLEERQEALRLIIQDVNLKYNELNQNISDSIKDLLEISKGASSVATQVDDHFKQLKQKEEGFELKYNQLTTVIQKVNQNIPKSY